MKTEATTPRLIRAKDAALKYQIKYTTLRDLAFRGKLPVVRLNRSWLFDEADIVRMIAAAKETLAR